MIEVKPFGLNYERKKSVDTELCLSVSKVCASLILATNA